MQNRYLSLLLKTGVITLTLVVTGTLILFIWLLIISPGKTAPIVDADGKEIPGSIAKAYDLSIGGVKQFLTVRSNSKENPILLILHGGPGDAEGHLFRAYNKKLEEQFIVVNWDQRGAGRSFSKNIPDESMTFEQFIADAKEVTEHVKKQYNKEKVILLGHSWGAFLAMHLAYKYPNDFYAIAAIGQVADQVKGEEISYKALLEEAKKRKDKKAIAILTDIGAPVNGKYGDGEDFSGLIKQRQIMMEYGGTAWGKDKMGLVSLLFKPLITAREYRLRDKINWTKGGAYSGPLLFPRVMQKPLIEEVPEIKVPYYLFQGKKDLNTPYTVAKKYFYEIRAPHKEMFSFENSAHFLPINQEREKFNALLIEKVRPEAFKEQTVSSE